MRTDDFDYNLPEELIAQEPAAVRDECRLLVMDRAGGEVEDRIFKDIIDYLRPGDLLVANETRVMPARLLGAKRGTGGGGRGVSAARVRRPGTAHEPRGLLGGARAAGQAPEAGRWGRGGFHQRRRGRGAFRRDHRLGPRRPARRARGAAFHAAGFAGRGPARRGAHAAASLHPRLRRRRGAVPDGVLAPGKLGGRAHGRAALHARAHRALARARHRLGHG